MSTIAGTLNGLAVISASTTPTMGSINIYDTSSGSLTPSLPALAGLSDGAETALQKRSTNTDVNTVTITRTGTDTFVDGSTNITLIGPGSTVLLQVVTIATVKYWAIKARGMAETVLTAQQVPMNIKLAAGTASVAPLVFTPGTNLTTPAVGAMEFDGTCFYLTPLASTRQVNDCEQFCTLTSAYTLTSQTAAQKLFNSSTNGSVTLAIGSYFFECFFDLSALSATSGAFGWDLTAGTAVIAGIKWYCVANKAALATAASPQSTVNTAANTAVCTATTNTVGWAKITGKLRISTAGTVTPRVMMDVAAPAVVGVDSYFRIWPAGSQSIASVGNWS
jgi:hypothetical protein